jgi:hypothetical protein
MPPKPRGDAALTGAERTRLYRARLALDAEAAGKPNAPKPKPPVGRRSRVARWNAAVRTLTDLLNEYDNWQDSLPQSMRDSPTAERLAAVNDLRAQVDDLAAAELPRGFDRD